MRLVTFDDDRVGALRDGEVVDLSDLVEGQGIWPPTSMLRLIGDLDALRPEIEKRLATAGGIARAEVRLRAPVQWPNKLIAFPTNYEDHIKEMHSANRADRNGFFLKAPSSLCGPNDVIELPSVGAEREIHHEAELGIVIGRAGRNIPAAQAAEHIAGDLCLLDLTVRGEGERGMRKSFDTFTPIGPALTTADEVPDPGNLHIELRVNGELRQNGNTKNLILGVPEMVELISSVTTIYPGDVIATGTPAGVGPLRPGDEVAATIDHLGSLVLPVVQGTSGRNVALDPAGTAR